LIKENGVFREASWDEAISLVAFRLKEIKAKHGGASFAAIASARCTNEEGFLVQKFARTVMGTNSIDNCSRVCHSPSAYALKRAVGTGAGTNSFDDIDVTDCILLIGANATEAHPVAGSRIKQAVLRGAKLIVVDPRNTELATWADVHLVVRPGSNVALVNAIGHVILEEGLINRDFIDKHTEGFEEVRAHLKDYSPEAVKDITGIDPELVREAARIYACAPSAMICWGLGVTEAAHGTNTVFGMINLALMTGNFGRPGTGANPFRGQNNVQGVSDMGAVPDVFSDYRSVTDAKARAEHEALWKVKLPDNKGYTIPNMIDAAVKGDLKAMWIVAEDIAQSDPDTAHIVHGLESLDFLVVQDIFMSETAKLADVIFPGNSFLEKDGTFVNSDRRIQRVRAAIPPVTGGKPEAWIVNAVARAMGADLGFGENPDPSKVMDEIASLSPNWHGVNYEKIERQGFVQWPCVTKDDIGTNIVHKDGNFLSGRGKFTTTPWQNPGELPDEQFPLFLTTGRQLFHYNVGTMTRRTDVSKLSKAQRETLRIHPKDASRLNVGHGDKVRVVSRRGAVEVDAEVTKSTNPGTVYMTFHFPETRTNILIGQAADEFTQCPEYKVSAVRIEKVNG
ncbi:MAG: formate dehydrogenase subunit alpha, partial [Planctomycetota bacterium]